MHMEGFEGTLGVIGVGVVGTAIKNALEQFKIQTKLYDKYKKVGTSIDDLLDCSMIFICLPTPFIYYSFSDKEHAEDAEDAEDADDIDRKGHYDKKELYQVIERLANLEYEGFIIIKSTVEPGTTKSLQLKYSNLLLVHNPEFLCAKTASEDFLNQTHIIIGTISSEKDISPVINFYSTYFPNALISITTSNESEMAKITCNSFYACKIQFFTEIKLFCDRFNISYDNVKSLIIKNGWINPMHLEVPGHDGNISFGGACLPKDVQCLNSLLEKHHIDNQVINAVVEENKKMR